MTRVLIVEDHEIVARLLGRVLRERAGVDVAAIVATAEAALDELARRDHGSAAFPDLALIDVSLPGMSGIDLLDALRAGYPNLPCLMLSGHTDDSYVRRALDAGARGYVIKGNPSELFDAIQQVLDGGIYLSEQLHP